MTTSTSDPFLVISVLGPPGSGKGTQSALLSQHYPNITHISIGAMLREEMHRPASPWADLLKQNMLAGRLGPPEMTVQILKTNLAESEVKIIVLDGVHANRHHASSIDGLTKVGFPRAPVPAHLFEAQISSIHRILVLDCAEATLVSRLKARARFDDVAGDANFAERMRTWREETAHVIAEFEEAGKVVRIDADRDVEAVWRDVKAAVKDLLGTGD